MTNRYMPLLAAAAAISFSTPAFADQDNPSLRALYDAGRCIVSGDRDAALDLMARLPIDQRRPLDMSALPQSLSECVADVGPASTLDLRGAIAQAMFFRDFGGFAQEPRRSRALVNLNLPVQDSPEGSRLTDLYRWGDCVVRNDTTHTERLLRSRVGSDMETVAIDGLQPYMAACAREGMQFTVRPSELRSVLAQSAYHSMYRYWTRQLDGVQYR